MSDVAKYRIRTHNAIAASGLERLPSPRFEVGPGLAEPDALMVRSAELQAEGIEQSVKAVARAGAGTNNIPVSALSARGVPVFNAPGANANAVKELVVAGMLLAARNLPGALAFVQTLGGVEDAEAAMEANKKNFAGHELSGRTLGVIGLGAIGVRVANAAYALGMKVLGFDPHMTVDGAWALSAEVGKAADLADLLARSDFVTVHVPLIDATRGLIDAAALAHLKPDAVLLNFSRSGIIDEQALRGALDAGQLARYVTDFPLKDRLADPRVIALPHLGASTAEAEENCAVMVADDLREFLEHGNVGHSVNFPRLRMSRAGRARLAIANRNVPNMIGQISRVLGANALNIAQMHNASRGELAYNLVDVDSLVPPEAISDLCAIEGVLSVRAL